ncbi:hypothetical protein WS98_25450 [Burkholderia territorii]|uniref:hypothetical protein n=1 Tax=Burkholderia territorii TaxID=1503055 RepID=UPI00075932AD|nr:hypothetical protein [Burkholderia territorii]KVL29774.1 hypothetical protein WS98_25450 [Burkholderia territorii]
MELATKRRHAGTKADLRALVNGQYSGDEHALIEQIAADLLAGVSTRVSAKPGAGKIVGLSSEAARREIAARLAEWLIRDAGRAGDERPSCLPVARWSPEEVIEHTGMSKSTLYRGDHAQFYSVVPPGKKNGRAYPAWQFTADVPSHLPHLLEILHSNSRMQVNTFFMSGHESLDDLSPAEVLAGMPFEDRREVAPAQERTLALPARARLDRVSALARREVADLD